MAKQVEKLSLLLVKPQASFGTAEAAPDGTNVIETVGPATMRLNVNGTESDLVASGFTQGAFIPGSPDLDLAFKVYAVVASADTPGQYGTLLELCALLKAEGTDGIFTYTPTSKISEMKDFTAWLYTGNLDSSGAVLRKAYNGIFAPKWTFANGKPTVMDLSAKLGYVAIPAAGTHPSVTQQTAIPPAFMGATTLTINGDNDYQVISGEIDMGQQVAMTTDPADTYGNGLSAVTDRKIKWNMKVYQDIPSVVDPETALFGKTSAALTVEYGAIPQKLKWASTKAQIIDVEHNDEGGVSTWTLSGIFVENNFVHTLTTK